MIIRQEYTKGISVCIPRHVFTGMLLIYVSHNQMSPSADEWIIKIESENVMGMENVTFHKEYQTQRHSRARFLSRVRGKQKHCWVDVPFGKRKGVAGERMERTGQIVEEMIKYMIHVYEHTVKKPAFCTIYSQSLCANYISKNISKNSLQVTKVVRDIQE